MKKYGDDADQFHNQGTRVEESKKWHEQNQLRHNYSYRSSSNSKSTYRPNYSNKNNQRNRKSRNTSYKPYKPYTHYDGPRPKVSGVPKYYYGHNYKSKSKNYQQKKSSNTSSKTNENDWITWIIVLALIGIFAIPMLFNPFTFFHDIGESTGTGPIPFFAFILIVIVSCILLGYYGTKN